MIISYLNEELRKWCYELNFNSLNSPFSNREIMAIRAHLGDLRAAPNLSEAPVKYLKERSVEGKIIIIIRDEIIFLKFEVVGKESLPEKIIRLKLIETSTFE